jgi:hypothetical protein
MGMGSEDMFNRPWSAVSRCSDDFQPEDRAWFIRHILMCSYNGLIQGQYFIGDWDMWWTDDDQAQEKIAFPCRVFGPDGFDDGERPAETEADHHDHFPNTEITETHFLNSCF